ncbi:transcription initiation protein [Rhizobium sp. NIBRBAC000502774]|nr:transcription initiation protein [Rhizobium sp. NIBRBAC000502774]
MPTFITIGYGNEEGYQRTDESVRTKAHAHDDWLKEGETRMGIAGTPTQVRNHGGTQVVVESGPFMHSPLPIAGFAIIEPADIEEAITMVSKTPCSVAYGVVELWPLQSNP